jgi:FtsP/CotA-like multicopper oxidase with cupredoxin domain
MSVSIDEHDLYVVAADGEFVNPQKVQRTHVNLGDRSRYSRLRSSSIEQSC